MGDWQKPWMKGTYGQRVNAVFALNARQTANLQQALYEICFCDPIEEVRLAAVHRLNQMQAFERPNCYEYTGAYFGSGTEPPHEEWFDSRIYELDDPNCRRSIIPYIIPEAFLFEIAMGDPNKSVARCAAERIQSTDLLRNLNYRSFDFEVGPFAEALIQKRRLGVTATEPSPIPDIKAKSREMPPKTPPLRAELREHAKKIINYADAHGLMHFRVKEADIELAIVAMQTFGDTKLAEALVRLYHNPNYALREKIKQFDGTKIHDEIEQDDYRHKPTPAAFLRLDNV
ncbi:hypothetical protein LJC63_02020 [Ruminococcaceae bacterium OttesenSCG-928-L11]|nr:hypothetical protein [Ruminococcaceae bacterium OttesenSCG-928-L11]